MTFEIPTHDWNEDYRRLLERDRRKAEMQKIKEEQRTLRILLAITIVLTIWTALAWAIL